MTLSEIAGTHASNCLRVVAVTLIGLGILQLLIVTITRRPEVICYGHNITVLAHHLL